MKSRRIFTAIFLIIAAFQSIAAAADWTNMERSGNIAYFFIANPAKVERYDITNRSWLTPITLPASRGPLTWGTVDADGIYTAFDKAVYRSDLAGAGETHLINTVDTVQGLFTDGNLLLINHSTSLYGKMVSLNKTTNTVIASFETYIDSVFGASIVRSLNRLVGTTRGVSPADVTYIEYRDNGTFVGAGDSPHHGDYTIGTRTWTFPNDGRFVDTTGKIYNTASLSYALSFGTTIDDIAFSGVDIPIVLSGSQVIAYTNGLLPAGSVALSSTAKNILVDGDAVIAFKASAGDGIATETVSLTQLNAPSPGQAVNSEGLAYIPDEVFTDNSGAVCLFSKAHQTIFRWDPETQTYLPGIPLIGGPDFVAYSTTTNTLYTAYTSGLIRKIDLGAAVPAEVPFVQLPSSPRGLSTAGAYLFADDASGAWETHYTYAPSGALVSSKDWNYYSRSYVWNAANQKMYFFRDDTSPNDLIWEEINASGTAYPTLAQGAIGTSKDSPLHDSLGFTHPIRPSPDGSVIALGGGVLHAGVTLERKTTALGNSFVDAAWAANGLVSMRAISGITQFQQWTLPTYGLGTVAQVPGVPRRMLPLSGNRFFALTSAADGTPSLYVLNSQLGVAAPPVLAAPVIGGLTIQSVTQGLVSWRDVAGETSYEIERMTTGGAGWAVIGNTGLGVTTFVDNSLEIGKSYDYRVTAINGSRRSSAGTGYHLDFKVPEAPTLSATVATPSQIKIDWAPSARAVTYKLYRRASPATSWSLIASPVAGSITYLDSYLSAATTYQYKIQGVNALGSSIDSEIVSASTPLTAPDSPYLNAPSANGPTTIYLSWSGAARAETLVIERMSGTSGTWAKLVEIPAGTYQYIDENLTPLSTYSYRMLAKNAVGASAYSSARYTSTPAIPLPSVPLNLDARPVSGTEISLTWSDATSETGYRIERQIGESEWLTVTSLAPNSISYSDTTVATGSYYNYRVIAFNTRGETSSDAVTVQAASVGALISDDFDPSIDYPYWAELSGASVISGPLGFNIGNALWMGGNSFRQVALNGVDLSMGGTLKFLFRAGNAAVDGSTHWDNSESGENVVLEYSAGNGAWQYLSLLTTLYPANSTWTAYQINLPAAARSSNTRFRWYQIKHSGENFDTWALDNVEIIGVLPALPEAPPFLMGSASSSKVVSLSWVAGARATSHIIQRRTPQTDWDEVGSVGIGQNYFTDESATPATLYSYRVIARNSSGDSQPGNYILVSTWSTLAEWRFQNYGTLSDSGLAQSLAENGTGVPNLIKFAFNMAASDRFYQVQESGGTRGMPNIQMHSPTGLLRVAFIRRRASSNPGITYTVEFSNNVSQWSATGREILAAPIDENFEYVVWEDEAPTGAPRSVRFSRVRVSE